MRRFSQRSALVTLSEINITPLLDLAFVLLIIFVITTPMLTQSIPMNLPKGGVPDKPRQARDIRTVEISAQGAYRLGGQPVSFQQIQANLLKDARANPNLVVDIRADERGRWKEVAALMDFCLRNGIKMAARTEPPKR